MEYSGTPFFLQLCSLIQILLCSLPFSVALRRGLIALLKATATYAFKPSNAFSQKAGTINKFVISINADGSVDIVATNINVESWGSEEINVDGNDVTKEEETPGEDPNPTPEEPAGELQTTLTYQPQH